MIADGYSEKLLNKGKKVYGPLIKAFATRAQAVQFKRRSSLFTKEEAMAARPMSPAILPKKIIKRDQEVQTELQIKKRIVIADKESQTGLDAE